MYIFLAFISVSSYLLDAIQSDVCFAYADKVQFSMLEPQRAHELHCCKIIFFIFT
jgi:hypothetical protein